MTLPAAEPVRFPAPRGANVPASEYVDYEEAKPAGGFGGGEGGGLDLRKLYSAFRRRLRVFVTICIIIFVAMLLGPIRSAPVYTATARVEIDTRKKEVVDIHQVESELPVNEANIVDTEVEVLKSRHLADRVVTSLHLEQDPEFNPALRKKGLIGSVFGGVKALFSAPKRDPRAPVSQVEAQEAQERVVDAVLGRLNIRRSGLTYVIDVNFTSADRAKAAVIANTFADRYLTEQMESKFDANRQANTWLTERTVSMEQDLKKAEDALAQYKISHNLLSAGTETLTQQEISNYNQQVALARAAQAEAEARARTARAQVAAGSNGADVGEALGSSTVSALKVQRGQLSTNVAQLSQKYGPRHPELLKAQDQLADIDKQIQTEINRALSNLDAQARIAKQRTESIEATLNQTRGSLASNNRTSVELNELQRNADATRTLYEAFLARAKQTGADEGIEHSDARVLSRAKIPTRPSAPNIPIILLLGVVSAIGLGLVGVIVAEMLDTGLTTADEVEKRLDIAFAGAIPHLASVIDTLPDQPKDEDGKPRWTLRSVVSALRAPLNPTLDPIGYVVEKPLSAFAESFRALRTSIRYSRLGSGGRVIAFVSALPSEGKTTTTICLGRIAAIGNEKVVIVDCDLRRRNVNKLLGVEPEKGLLEVLSGEATLDEVLLLDKVSGAWVLPLAKTSFTPKMVFSTPVMDKVLAELTSRFDLVLLDTPPVLAVADCRDLAAKADGVIFLARWRHTPQKAIESALRLLAGANARLIGLSLTQVDMKEQARYGYGDAGYYYGRYRGYYAS